jgi:hypothetical protein
MGWAQQRRQVLVLQEREARSARPVALGQTPQVLGQPVLEAQQLALALGQLPEP